MITTAAEFIYKRTKELVNEFKNIKASVEFDQPCDNFCIMIQPKDFFNKSKELKSRYGEITHEFYHTYFDVSILFTDKNIFPKIDFFDYFITGEDYDAEGQKTHYLKKNSYLIKEEPYIIYEPNDQNRLNYAKE